MVLQLASTHKPTISVPNTLLRSLLIHCTFVLLATLFTLFLGGCESENPDLVTPPLGRDSIIVRLFNAQANTTQRLYLEGKSDTVSVASAMVHQGIIAPTDSAYITVSAQSSNTFKTARRINFIKNSIITLVALPSALNAPNSRQIDTVIALSTLRGQPTRARFASVRLLCTVADSTSSYEVRIGCQNGDQIGNAVQFREQTGYSQILSGQTVLSLVKNNALVGIYQILLPERSFSTLVVYNDGVTDKLMAINELESTPLAVTVPQLILQDQRSSDFRVVNIGAASVASVRSSTGDVVATALPGGQVSGYTRITACQSEIPDVFTLYDGTDPIDSVRTSIGVRKQYSIVTYTEPTMSGVAKRLLLVEPLRQSPSSDSAVVRVVSTSSRLSLRVRLGARTDIQGRFHNGEILASSLGNRSVSTPVSISPGTLPLTLVTMEQPERFLGGYIGEVKAGKEYLLIVTDNQTTGGYTLWFVESSSVSSALTPLAQGVLVQLVSGVATKTPVGYSLGTMVRDTLTYTNSIATILAHGSHTLTFGSSSKSITVDTNQRTLLVMTGANSALDMLVYTYATLASQPAAAAYRFINASNVNSIRIGSDTTGANAQNIVYAESLAYGSATQPAFDERPARINIMFSRVDNAVRLYAPLSFAFSRGKAYSVLFTGNDIFGYTMIIQEEF